MPPKPDYAPNVNETVHTAFNVELSPTKPDKDLSHTHRPSALIIEDWVFDSKDDYEAELSQNAPSFVQPTEQVKPPRPFVRPVKNSILATNHKSDISLSLVPLTCVIFELPLRSSSIVDLLIILAVEYFLLVRL
nr:hypothetical protein [Tanacetum cinerariifolium]